MTEKDEIVNNSLICSSIKSLNFVIENHYVFSLRQINWLKPHCDKTKKTIKNKLSSTLSLFKLTTVFVFLYLVKSLN